jgi:cytochrome P450
VIISPTETPALKAVPYVREFPFIGSQPTFKNDLLRFLKRMSQLGEISGFHFGTAPFLLINTPEYVHDIMIKHAPDFSSRGRFIHKTFNNRTLSASDGEYHRRQRKLMATLFQPRHITRYTEIMTRYGEQLEQAWNTRMIIDLYEQMTSLSMSILSKMLFDLDIASDSKLPKAMDVIFEHSNKVLFSLFTLPAKWPTSYNSRLHTARLVVQDFLRQAREHLYNNRLAEEDRHDFISLLLQTTYDDGTTISERQALEECWGLFAAATGTTAITLTSAWYLLCQHPDIYQKVQQEVDSVLKGQMPTEADLPNLPYCLQVIKEAMRIYPPATILRREAARDVVVGEYLITKGTTVLASPYTLHRIAKYFPQPEQFDPERFSPEREREIPRYVYLPFGIGPRVCLGNNLALMEVHLLLALLAQRVTFTLMPGKPLVPDLKRSLALRFDREVVAVVERRQPNYEQIKVSK